MSIETTVVSAVLAVAAFSFVCGVYNGYQERKNNPASHLSSSSCSFGSGGSTPSICTPSGGGNPVALFFGCIAAVVAGFAIASYKGGHCMGAAFYNVTHRQASQGGTAPVVVVNPVLAASSPQV